MKKFILGLLCGVMIAASTAVYASDEIQAALFSVKMQFNGEVRETGSRFEILNYDGHTYVPLRFMAENLGAGAVYDQEAGRISVVSEPKSGSDAQKKIWAATYRLERGMDAKDVKSVLGEPSFLTLIDSSKQQLWRYDIGAADGYSSGGLSADTDGLQRGDLEGQLFIRWNAGGQVDRYELWTAKKAEDDARNVYSFTVYPDGSTSGSVVN